MGSQFVKTKISVIDIAKREIAAHVQFKQKYLDLVKSRDWLNDYFVTLTFKYGYKNNEVQRSCDLRRYFFMLDRAILGKNAKNRGRKLYRYAVFELTKGGHLHVHILLENPSSVHVQESAHKRLILSTWQKLDCSGSELANKVMHIVETPEHVEAYIHKFARVSNSLMFDPTLWHLPNDSAQCDALGIIES